MTKEEFNNLEFGDKVYDNNGVLGLVIDASERHFKKILFTTDHIIDFTDFSRLSFQKPKKKVKKEIKGFIPLEDLEDAMDAFNDGEGIVPLLYSGSKEDENDIVVTISFETEE